MSLSAVEFTRRPIKARSLGLVQHLAAFLARLGVTPNQVSVAGMFFAALGSACMAAAQFAPFPARAIVMMVAALFVQLRLLCNLIDGLIAVEGGKQTKLGEVFNEMPDRVSDTLLLVSAGYCAGNGALGWAAASFAMLTAYVRAFAAQSTGAQDFRGPMAKQHRMFVLTVALLLTAMLEKYDQVNVVLSSALVLIAVGSAVTSLRRTSRLVRYLSSSD